MTKRTGRGQAAANANGRALFGVGAGTPVDRHLTGDKSTVFFDARLRIDHRFMTRQGRDESLFPIEFYAHRPAVGVKCQSDGNRLDFTGTGPADYVVKGFTTSDPEVWDVTSPLAPVLITGGTVGADGLGGFQVAFRETLAGSRSYLVLTPAARLTSSALVVDAPSTLASSANSVA